MLTEFFLIRVGRQILRLEGLCCCMTNLLNLTSVLSMCLSFRVQGDAPTSGRVFEAVAAGCVPVIISPRELMPTDLPFPSLIKWDEIALFTENFEKMLEVWHCLSQKSVARGHAVSVLGLL